MPFAADEERLARQVGYANGRRVYAALPCPPAGGVTTQCCPDGPMPETLFATLQFAAGYGEGDCPCLFDVIIEMEYVGDFGGGITNGHIWHGSVTCAENVVFNLSLACVYSAVAPFEALGWRLNGEWHTEPVVPCQLPGPGGGTGCCEAFFDLLEATCDPFELPIPSTTGFPTDGCCTEEFYDLHGSVCAYAACSILYGVTFTE